jgi:hypothetical protein
MSQWSEEQVSRLWATIFRNNFSTEGGATRIVKKVDSGMT